jgi:ariadne-1
MYTLTHKCANIQYYNRYANHEQSAKLDRELFTRTEKKMGQLQITSDMSWIEVQFLKNGVDTLSACRQTLKWSYALAYVHLTSSSNYRFYLEKSNQTDIFETNQADLEFAVEGLSELCEKPVEIIQEQNLKQVILDKAVYVQQRQLVLLGDTAQGLAEGRWDFNVHTRN